MQNFEISSTVDVNQELRLYFLRRPYFLNESETLFLTHDTTPVMVAMEYCSNIPTALMITRINTSDDGIVTVMRHHRLVLTAALRCRVRP